MDFTWGLITGAYVVFALTVFYIAYIIEVKLGKVTVTQTKNF